MLRVVFMGTSPFAVPALETLYELTKLNQVIGVYTQPDRPAGRGLGLQFSAIKKKALELKLPIFQPENFKDPKTLEEFKNLNPDIVVVAAYGLLLPTKLLETPKLSAVNIHASLLPRWRGAAPIAWAILKGDLETGVTIQKISQKLDAGDVLLQQKTPILTTDYANTLHDRLSQIGARLMLPTLEGLMHGQLQSIAQDESLMTYAHKLTKEMAKLDLSQLAVELERQVRAFYPWPGTSILVNGVQLKIKKVICRKEIQGFQGKLFEKSGMLLLGAKDGSLEIERLQWEGKKETGALEFLNGLKGRGVTLPIELS
ncbi:MAG: methionyl-tRNA formyltransferase [Deltaproteobacteria bacterium]|nr:methionyl-tRNA formyltransferase [Deltaproteobacteria bacterium]